jgi:N-acetylmuramoyl-L-alanine amidase
MNTPPSPEQIPEGHQPAAQPEDSPGLQSGERASARQKKTNGSTVFTFWRGLQTALGAAFIVATLFTLWTPGSLLESSLEARMAQALEASEDERMEAPDPTLAATQAPENLPIGIVAGHYGFDPGAVCPNGLREVDVNLEIATLVQKNLTDLGYTVDLLQEFDPQLNGYRGSVLVSIHADSCAYVNEQATGYKVAAALSEQNLPTSQRLTACLTDRYGQITGLPYHSSVTPDMSYYHAFNEIDMETTAAIIETGFLNLDQQFLTEKSDVAAEGIVAGIVCFLNQEVLHPTPEP